MSPVDHVRDAQPAPIAVALDAPDIGTAEKWVRSTAPFVSTFKVGLEMFLRDGADSVNRVRSELTRLELKRSIFLDLKLHDIPATVGGAAQSIAPLTPDFLTVHASGGPAMISAAARALPQTKITAVTVLTSLGPDDLRLLRMDREDSIDARDQSVVDAVSRAAELVVAWAVMAVDSGARAIVCSPQEVAQVRAVVPADITLITPGVRPVGAAAGDQRRVATPESALGSGADLLVIGRPITHAADPGKAAADIAEQCAAALSQRAASSPAK
ncbi:MAG: orotidine-5'-phosphate decarboxylase [Candidatus Nanopelagicales bacterium]